MNSTFNIFSTLAFLCFFTLAGTAQTQTNKTLGSDSMPATNIDFQQTLEQVLTLSKITGQTPAETNITETKTIQTPTVEQNTYAFSFNHKQFMKPIVKKSAYC